MVIKLFCLPNLYKNGKQKKATHNLQSADAKRPTSVMNDLVF